MFGPINMKTLHPLQPSSSSALSSTKLKSLIHTLILSHVRRLFRALKSLFLKSLGANNNYGDNIRFPRDKKTNKIILGSFRLHYNWCSSKSSHFLPLPSRASPDSSRHFYCDSNLDTVVVPSGGGEDWAEAELAGYLQWLDDKVDLDDDEEEKLEMNEIDKLAETFIADCHEKFKLEKQESDRKFHEMLARGI